MEFRYEALDSRDRIVRGIVCVESATLIAEKLERMGYRPVFVAARINPDLARSLGPGLALFGFSATDRTGRRRRGVTIADCEGDANSLCIRMGMTGVKVRRLGKWGVFMSSLIEAYSAAQIRARMSD